MWNTRSIFTSNNMYIINEQELQALKRIKRYLEIYLQYDDQTFEDDIYCSAGCLEEDFDVLRQIIENTQ